MPEFYDYDQWDGDGETSLWYSRFCYYRDLGPARTMVAAVRRDDNERGVTTIRRCVPTAWYRQAEKFYWVERVASYDRYRLNTADAYASNVDKATQRIIKQAEQIIGDAEAPIESVIDACIKLLQIPESAINVGKKRRKAVVSL